MRLTKEVRDQIHDAALNASFKKETEALTRQETKLTALCYKSLFLASARAAAAAMPKGWIPQANSFLLNISGEQIRLTSKELFLVPTTHHHHESYVLKNADLAAEVRAWAYAKEDLRTRRKQAGAALSGMLLSVSTIKKLFEVWPEGQAFYKNVAPSPINLPAAHVGEVNKLLKLKAAA
jgi:hypothetical protein